jgi:hypothetical protein
VPVLNTQGVDLGSSRITSVSVGFVSLYRPLEPLRFLLDNDFLPCWFSVFQFTRTSAGSFAWRSELLELRDELLVRSCHSLKSIPEHRMYQQINRPDWTILKTNKDSIRGGSRLFSIRSATFKYGTYLVKRRRADWLLCILILELESLTSFQRLFHPLRLLRSGVLARQLYLQLLEGP